jgi:hypothetical protein
LQAPAAFNNTGQIVGQALDPLDYSAAVCEFYDGTRYRTVAAETSVTYCSPAALNDRNATTGTVDIVGVAATAFQSVNSTFYSVANLNSHTIDNSFYTANPDSIFSGINASGTAVATAYYAPLSGFFTNEPAFLRPAGQNSLTLLQPSCTTPSAHCGTLEHVTTCSFGGCLITSDGSVLLEESSGNYELLAPGGKTQTLGLIGSLFAYLPTVNNAKQVLYATYPANATGPLAYILDLKTGRTKTIPPVPMKNCLGFSPLSMSNNGRVLGYAACAASLDPFFFTYDPVHGTQSLAPKLPAGTGSVEPFAINDSGQILIMIVTSANVVHWGILQPPS